MSEPRASYVASVEPRRLARGPKRAAVKDDPGAAAGFPGCVGVPMTAAQYAEMDRHVDYWSAEEGVGWMVSEVYFAHESPAHRLAMLLDRVAQARGAAIECGGNTSFHELGPQGDSVRAMEPDQTVYLQAAQPRTQSAPFFVLGSQAPPDLVLEVDHTTDARRRKLGEYQKWRFPEVWVEVPEPVAGRRSRRRPGLTIHVLNEKTLRYAEAPASRALPGWLAEEIHLALNEPKRSARTWAALERVGRALGKREGTEPTEDPHLRRLLAEARTQGHKAGLAAGRAAAEAAKAAAVEAVLRQRGIEHSQGLLEGGPLAARSTEQAIAAALACRNEANFLERLSRAED